MNHLRLAAIAAAVVCAIQPAAAANLIVNGGFDSDTSGWTAGNQTSLWRDASNDVNESPASGALAMSTSNGSNSNLSAHQCITGLAGGSDFSFGVAILPNTSDSYGMTCTARAGSDCSGAELGSADAAEGATSATGWVAFRSASPFVLPAKTASVDCAITSVQPLRPAGQSAPDGFTSAIWADEAFFAPGTTPVSLQAFDVE